MDEISPTEWRLMTSSLFFFCVTFNDTGDDQNDPRVREQFPSVTDTIVDLFGSVNFLHGGQYNFDGQKFGHLVRDVERRVKHTVPDKSGQ